MNKKMKISGVYKVTNNVTGDFYIGSSCDIKKRWISHKSPSTWKHKPNSLLYKAFQEYGLENFKFMILMPAYPEHLKQMEQEFIEMLQPVYNDRRSKGLNVERRRESYKKYKQTDKGKEASRKGRKKYIHSNKGKETQKRYRSQLCIYNSEELTLYALMKRFHRAGIPHATLEAKKYLIEKEETNENIEQRN